MITTDGRIYSGLLLREEADVLVLADEEGKEQRFSRSEIEEQRQSRLSPMPADAAVKLTADAPIGGPSYIGCGTKGSLTSQGPS